MDRGFQFAVLLVALGVIASVIIPREGRRLPQPHFAVHLLTLRPAQNLLFGKKMDLNRARELDLEVLPGIGKKTAREIIRIRKTMR